MTDETETCEMCGIEREESGGECPECGHEPLEAEEQREEFVSIIALLREVDRRLNHLGGKQAMSVGPVLGDVEEFQQTIRDRARDYGVIESGEPLASLKHDAATQRDVVVREQSEWSVDGSVVAIGDTEIIVTEEGGDPANLGHVGEEDGYVVYRVDGDCVTLHFMEASE